MTGAGVAAQRQADGPVHRAQPVGLPASPLRDARQRLGKGPPGTGRCRATETADPDQQDGGAAETREVAEAAPVGTVNPPRWRPTRGTGSRHRRLLCAQRDAWGAMVDLVNDMETREKANRMQGNVQGEDRVEDALPFI